MSTVKATRVTLVVDEGWMEVLAQHHSVVEPGETFIWESSEPVAVEVEDEPAPTEGTTREDILTPHNEGDHDLFAHGVTKLALERAIFEGIPAIALCGKRWLPTKDAKRYPVCPTCKEILDTYWPGPEEVK